MINGIRAKNDVVQWIQNWFEQNGKDCKAIIGISGGTDSSVAAALCVEALGKDRVFGVLMPQHNQSDIHYAYELCEFLDIDYTVVNIGSVVDNLIATISSNIGEVSTQTRINLPPRIRMSTLYAVSQSKNGRVINTCNLSEDWIGYSTRYGDAVGDMSPLSNFTKTEVKEIGRACNLPSKFVDKTPSDGLCGKTDEDNLGFTYDVLDRYISTGEIDDENIKKKIDDLHQKNLFKLQLMPSFSY